MRATIKSDPGRGPGYGIIEICETQAADTPTFLLRRASDGKLLSSSGWQESEIPLCPDAWDSDSSVLRMAVGPAIVDELDHLDAYRISLPGQGQCILAIENLLYSNINGGQGMGELAPPVTEPPLPEPAPEPEPPVAPVVEEKPLPAEEMPASKQAKRSPLLMILLFFVLLAAAGAAAWWFFLREPATPPLPPIGSSTPEKQPPLTPAPETQQPLPATTATPQQKQSPLRMAREHLRGHATPDLSLALARPLRRGDAASEESDAAFLLLEDAAQKGNAEAMLLVGQYYDPTNSLPKGSIPPDMSQARYWYEQARQKGQPQAIDALRTLRSHVQAEADRGNAEARLLLRQWTQGE